MKEPFDIHTHKLLSVPSQAIINIRFPQPFQPQVGAYYSIGLHPWDLPLFDQTPPDWNSFTQLASHPQVVAIGECGVDKLVHPERLAQQQAVWLKQVEIAEQLHKPLIIHNVRSFDLLAHRLRLVRSARPWILHGFRGNPFLAHQWVALGGYLSFGSRFNEAALCATPINRLLVETDACELDIREVYDRLATIRNVETDELIAQVWQNVEQVFFKRQEL